MAALTAARLRMMPLAKGAMRLTSATLGHRSKSDAVVLPFIAWNLSVRPSASNHPRRPRSVGCDAVWNRWAAMYDRAFLERAELDACRYDSALTGGWPRGTLVRRNVANG